VPHAGGMANYGYQCGMLWGAAFAAGAQAYRLLGPGPRAETAAIMATQEIVKSFRARTNNEINCLEITDMNMQGKVQIRKILKFFIKGGPVRCFNMAAKCARDSFIEINNALSKKHGETPSPPVSCAAILAQKLGASDLHTVMAAGLAGGIGLSGGACGALGTAIWLNEMNALKEGANKKVFIGRANSTIDKFIKNTDFKFECSEIVGRKFENAYDHAVFLRDGGCSKIIEVLAGK
jgi:hypothetical protein